MIRTPGAMTQLAKSRLCRPVLRRKRRNDLSAVHAVATVRLDWCAARSLTKASRSAAVTAETDLLRRFKSDRNAPATSTSRSCGIPLGNGDTEGRYRKRPRMKCILCNQTTAGTNRPILSRSRIGLTKVPRSHQRQLPSRFKPVLPAITVEATNPTKVETHSARRHVPSSPDSSEFPLVLIERVQLWIHLSHDAISALVACLCSPEHVTNSIRRYAPENDALQITPDSR